MENSHENPMPQDMRDALDKFSKESQEAIEAFLAPMEALEPPPLIYHYTDDTGLRGILETGKFWLSDIFNLNDPSELKHGYSLAITLLKRKAANNSVAVAEFIKILESFGKSGGNIELANYFICSFSSCGNDLGQWRAYADNGRGYALGFAAKSLEEAFINQGSVDSELPSQAAELTRTNSPDTRFLKTFPLIYKDAQLAEIHTKNIDSMFDLISLPIGRHLPRPVNLSYLAELATTLAVRILIAALHFKHGAYSNEQEYRFLEVHGKMETHETKVRSRPYSLIRYREFNWKRVAAQALNKIVVGPSADPQRGLQFAQNCVRIFCSSPVDIVVSDIPYRAL